LQRKSATGRFPYEVAKAGIDQKAKLRMKSSSEKLGIKQVDPSDLKEPSLIKVSIMYWIYSATVGAQLQSGPGAWPNSSLFVLESNSITGPSW
jgi:hypothetical protein